MRRFSVSVILSLGMILISGRAFSQSNTWPWPMYPGVGIGTQLSGGWKNSLHLHYKSTDTLSQQAIIRLSEGDSTSTNVFGILGLMPAPSVPPDTAFSSLSRGADLILHDHQDGDIIITNFTTSNSTRSYGTAIRFATTGDTLLRSSPPLGHHDLERLTIMGNGNVGIDLPPSSTGLDSVKDQFQIGGGVTPYPGNPAPSGPLTFYGGNPFENMPKLVGGGLFPGDWRYIAFNKYEDHVTGYTSRFTPMSSSMISFADGPGGLLNFSCYPYSSSLGISDFSKALTLQLTGNEGLQLWFMDTTANPYHHLLDIFIPSDTSLGIRNTNGLSFFHTPVCITSDHGGVPLINFTNLGGVHPDIGDDSTWMLAVYGPALFQEAFVSLDWPDYVFDPDYNLTPLDDVEKYLKSNRHLPDIPSASKMAETGVPLGRTEAAITKQMEEMMLYIEQLNHKIETLESEVKDLKNQKGR